MLSIILTTCNRPEQLKNSIKSVLAQSYKNYELIVSDDFSDADVSEVVKVFDSSRISVVRTPENLGYMNNALFGMSKAKGDYICFMCDDDELTDAEFYNDAITLMEKEDADLVFGRLSISSEYGLHVYDHPFKESYDFLEFLSMIEEMRFNYHDYFGLGTCVFKREKLLSVSPFSSIFKDAFTVDIYNLIKYAMECKKIMPINRVVYKWTQPSEQSISGRDKLNLPKQLIDNLAFPIDMYLYLQTHPKPQMEHTLPFLNKRIEYSFNAILADAQAKNSTGYFTALLDNNSLADKDVYIYCKGWVGLALQKFLADRNIAVKAFIDDFKDEDDVLTFDDFRKAADSNTSVIIASYKYKDIYRTYRKLEKIDKITILDLYETGEQ